MPLRVAVDANVLIAGVVWPRWPYEVLRHAQNGDFRLVLSPIVLHEARKRIQKDFPDFLEEFEFLLTLFDYELAPLPTPAEVAANQRFVRQKEDIPIALSIQAAQVDYFVTYDRDFTDPGETTEQVRRAIPGIILPPVFLKEVMGWTSEALEAIRKRTWAEIEDLD